MVFQRLCLLKIEAWAFVCTALAQRQLKLRSGPEKIKRVFFVRLMNSLFLIRVIACLARIDDIRDTKMS